MCGWILVSTLYFLLYFLGVSFGHCTLTLSRVFKYLDLKMCSTITVFLLMMIFLVYKISKFNKHFTKSLFIYDDIGLSCKGQRFNIIHCFLFYLLSILDYSSLVSIFRGILIFTHCILIFTILKRFLSGLKIHFRVAIVV